jgi:CBS domain-containing protein
VGQALALGFIGLGLLMVVRGHVLNGVWMALIGWFLQNAAIATKADATVRELLRGVTVAQAMTRDCPRISRDVTLERLVHTEVLGGGRRCFLVTDNGHLEGLVTVHEVKAVPRDRWPAVKAGEVMTALEKLTTIEPDADLYQALEKMDDARVAQLPVVAGESWLGMIGREQVLHYIRTRAELGI